MVALGVGGVLGAEAYLVVQYRVGCAESRGQSAIVNNEMRLDLYSTPDHPAPRFGRR